MVLLKKDFVKIIQLIKKQDKFLNSFTDVLEEVSSSMSIIDVSLDKYTREALDIFLGNEFGFEAVDVIYDWIYDDWNKPKKIKTESQLYDYIMKMKKEK